eukprot:2900746-Ditylum_brightwellii.AAC.2
MVLLLDYVKLQAGESSLWKEDVWWLARSGVWLEDKWKMEKSGDLDSKEQFGAPERKTNSVLVMLQLEDSPCPL